MGALLWWNAEAGGGKWKVALCLWFFHLPPAPLHLVRPPDLGTTGFVGDCLGTENYDRRLRIIANPLKPMARSESAEGSGTVKIKPWDTSDVSL